MKILTWKARAALSAATIALATLTGCISSTATPAVHGKAFVTTNTIFSGSMYHCDAQGGEPMCWRVVERASVAK